MNIEDSIYKTACDNKHLFDINFDNLGGFKSLENVEFLYQTSH